MRRKLFKMLTPTGTDEQDEALAYNECQMNGQPYSPPLKPFLDALLGFEAIHTATGSVGDDAGRRDWVKMVQLLWLLTKPQEVKEPAVNQALLAMLAKHSPAWAGLSLEDLKCVAECMERVHIYGPFEILSTLGLEVGQLWLLTGLACCSASNILEASVLGIAPCGCSLPQQPPTPAQLSTHTAAMQMVLLLCAVLFLVRAGSTLSSATHV